MTAPSDARRSLVRTNAPPLPGLTCWNSRILKIVPSTSMWLPFLNWLVEITGSKASLSRRMSPLTDLDVAERAAQAAARVALDAQGGAVGAEAKDAPTDLVSEVDRAAEAAAVAVIQAARPDDGLLGEEGARREGTRTWVIDALDG